MQLDDSVFRLAFTHSQEGIFIADAQADGNPIIFVNPAFEDMTGYSSKDIVGNQCHFLQLRLDLPASNVSDDLDVRKLLKQLERGDNFVTTVKSYKKNGDSFWNELSVSILRDNKGRRTHILGIQKDVSRVVCIKQELLEKNSLLEKAKEELEQLTVIDSLTDIHNRRYFDQQYSILWNMAKRRNETLTLFLIDIDNFKMFNDTYGHVEGDAVLKAVAQQLSKGARRASDVVARYGGEEFVIVAFGLNQFQAQAYSESLRYSVENLNIVNRNSATGFVTISIGVTNFYPTSESSEQAVLVKTDEGLYAAKKQGKNVVVFSS